MKKSIQLLIITLIEIFILLTITNIFQEKINGKIKSIKFTEKTTTITLDKGLEILVFKNLESKLNKGDIIEASIINKEGKLIASKITKNVS